MSGNGPPASANSSNWPGAMPPPGSARYSTTDTAESMVSPSSDFTGGSSATVVSAMVHPATGCACTDVSGVSVGSWTRTPTVLAAALSLGTRNVTLPNPPGAASAEETETCADAGP